MIVLCPIRNRRKNSIVTPRLKHRSMEQDRKIGFYCVKLFPFKFFQMVVMFLVGKVDPTYIVYNVTA